MCRAISILKSRINLELIEEYNLESFARQRAEKAEIEIVFDYAARVQIPYLPVIHDGQLRIYEWGNRSKKAQGVYETGWCRLDSLEAGKWKWQQPEEIVIPAQFGLENGIWFSVTEGMKGVVVKDRQQQWHAYLLTQQASVYYANMTKSDRMPVLVGEQM